MRALTAEEADVIEEAINYIQWLDHGLTAKHTVEACRASLRRTVADLLSNYDGQWRRPTGV